MHSITVMTWLPIGSNTHGKKVVHCKHCVYTTQTKARMHLHVCIHTTGFKCTQCGSKFPIQRVLDHHLVLHEKHYEFQCATCGKIFATSSSRNVHMKGKHGVGYVCPCGKCFESPAQWSWHSRNCTG